MDNPLKTFYKNRLPHIAPIGAEFFITFRLADSLPLTAIQSLKEELETSVQKLRKGKPEDYEFKIKQLKYEFSFRYDKYLDKKGFGNCFLKNKQLAIIVGDKLHQYDGEYYELEAYTIMPNHVHLLIDTSLQLEKGKSDSDSKYTQLDKIMRLIKGGSAFEANKVLERKGAFWMKDSYDHYVRNEKDWENIIEYIINNPVNAGLVSNWKDWDFTFCKYF